MFATWCSSNILVRKIWINTILHAFGVVKAAQCYRFELTHNKYNYQEQHFNLSGYEYGNQGANCQIFQPDSLANFIKYCQKVAPAKNYILLISDHGGAYGVSADYDKSLLPTRY